jgi:hypothetical protein
LQELLRLACWRVTIAESEDTSPAASDCHEAVDHQYRQSATSSYPIARKTAMPVPSFDVQPP